jgi:dihydroflavonol-4-reductase
MKFWVAGATGFLGSHLVRTLRAQGHEVVAVSRSGGHVDDHPVKVVDVLDADAVAKSAKGCDGAFLATGRVSRDANAAEELHRLHVTGTTTSLEGVRRAGIKRVVYASTSGTIAVGKDPDRIHDESDEAPLEVIAPWPYYRTKLYGERAALEAASSDFEVVVVNPSLLLGPGDLRESSTKDVRLFLERAIPAAPAGGLAFVDARDAAEGMRLAFEKGRSGERYLLNGANLTVSAFFQRLSRMTGIPAPLFNLPKNRALAMGAHRLYEKALTAIGGKAPVDEASVEMALHYWYCSSEKAERELGFVPRDPGETLRDTVRDLVRRRVVMPKELRSWMTESEAPTSSAAE